MGSSSSKPKIDNTGLANGNIINNGNIIETIENDLSAEALLLKILIVLKTIHIIMVAAKWFAKFLRKRENQHRNIESSMLSANRNPQ